jgi:hypothetical protein
MKARMSEGVDRRFAGSFLTESAGGTVGISDVTAYGTSGCRKFVTVRTTAQVASETLREFQESRAKRAIRPSQLAGE